jgi:hypothetical protein
MVFADANRLARHAPPCIREVCMPAEQPEIFITRSHQKNLKKLIAEAFRLKDRIAPFLSAEVRRAAICTDDALPENVVAPGRSVSYQLDWGPPTRHRTLVYPQNFISERSQISLLSPIGALRFWDCGKATRSTSSCRAAGFTNYA